MNKTSKSIKTDTYATLVKDIAELCSRARKTLVESYWQIGNRIVEQEQQGDDTPEYGVRLLERLSRIYSTSWVKGILCAIFVRCVGSTLTIEIGRRRPI